jgi:glycosyltransferase involved in cell wall biosynthesis
MKDQGHSWGEAQASPLAVPSAVLLGPLAERPLLSVVVPSYNQGKFIRATIDSILNQDYRPLEILVIDGASTDNTVDVLRSYAACAEMTWISEPDGGVVEAVNKGLTRARGDVLAIQSSDDCYLPGAFRRVMDEFKRNTGTGLLYGNAVKVGPEGQEISRHRSGPYSLENLFLLKTWIPQPSAFFRRELLEAVGRWDARIPYTPDTDLWIRMAFRTEVRRLDDYLSQRRMHAEQRDTQTGKIVRDYVLMIEQSPDLRGAPAELRRAARAGTHLIRAHYNDHGSYWYAAWHLWRGGMIDRRALDIRAILRYLLHFPLRSALARCKRPILGLWRRHLAPGP